MTALKMTQTEERYNMELSCTKKLLECIGLKPEKASVEIDPLFEWTANLVTINRRKTIVVVHAVSRCAFVLYGVTAKYISKLPELILDGIRRLLESEYVRPEIIEQYLNDLGREVSFRANSSRKTVAACNKVCERLDWFSELLQTGELYQKGIQPALNDDVLGGEYLLAYEALIGKLQERYGDDIRSCRALELEVSLELHTPCKRRIIVPENLNFYQFHNVLQACFNWNDCHLHQFVTEVDAVGYPTKIIQPQWDEIEEIPDARVQDSQEVTLKEVFANKTKIIYEYDFGDGWIHTITLCREIDDCRTPYPHCIMAIGDAPMEDCGGPDGFAYIMKALNDPTHPEHKEITEWVRSTWWQPLDVQRITAFIKSAHRRSLPS